MSAEPPVGHRETRQYERDEYFRILESVARENIEKVQGLMADEGVDALVLNRTDNTRYLVGIGPYDSFSLSAEHGAVIPRDGEPTFLAAPRLAEDLADRHWLEDVRSFSTGKEDAVDAFASVLADHGAADGTVGLDPHMEFQFARQFGDALPRADVVDAGDLLYRARAVKSPKEIALIDEGLEIAEIGIEAGIEAVDVGVRECDVSGTIMKAMLDAGAAGAYALPAIVSSGVRWSRCQEFPSQKRIRRNEFVQLDEGPMYKGYYSELARMLFLGTPSDAQRDMYQATFQAHQAAIDAIEPGVSGQEVYEASREIFAEYGYEDSFTMGYIGHGIGTVAHEPPYIGPTANPTLEENMIVMIEPGLFNRGVAGVRFEDMVLVTDSGSKVLSRTAHPHHDKFV
ncbi:Xaa-Pro peptidase family protein [Halobellus sp. H-GB7]|uniref:M24 family metallopeptidase n=1 Tax=Halobellus sp. H-GB7 TaxID=3069756 RepID=UPI0027B74F83|nr:Xaa-Pro peptidase family protein [Halobellus sp. H-GB7]MDQ2054645.1 Xaa-Pro peptidase family protein [Halobellus sp. H-GB7]